MSASDTPAAGSETSTPATGWKPQLPFRVRAKPRAYGTGRYGIDKYDSQDATRYGWTRIGPALTAFLALFLSAAQPARAQNAYCESADAATSVTLLCKPSVDVEGATPWGTKWNTNADMIDLLFTGVYTSTGTIASRTTALEALAAALGVSTASLSTSLTAESATRAAADLAIGITTGTLRTDLTNEAAIRAAADISLGVDTGTLAGRATSLEIWQSSASIVQNALSVSTVALVASIATKQNSFVGITSTTCSGYINNSVFSNGVATGGSCTAVSAGVAATSTTTWTGGNYFVGATTVGVAGTDMSGAWVAWTPTWGGFSAAPTVTARYMQIGKTVTANVVVVSEGTSNSNVQYFSLPVAAKRTGWVAWGMGTDNGDENASAIYTGALSTTASTYLTLSGVGTWFSSGNKAWQGTFTYEAN